MKNTTMTLREYRDSRKTPYAWPGGDPLFYVMADGGALCHKCGAAEWRVIVRNWTDERSGWKPCGVEVNWEDTDLVCAHCGQMIESAYGERNCATPGVCRDDLPMDPDEFFQSQDLQVAQYAREHKDREA